jgi:glycosyltransferase involved in cell wall biosynthesis
MARAPGTSHRVLIAYKSLPRYRLDFFQALHERLAEKNVDLSLTFGQPTTSEVSRRDTGTLPWAESVPNKVWTVRSKDLIWQPCVNQARRADLVIVEQASRLLLNYVLLLCQLVGAGRVAFWGHGANLQRHRAHAGAEFVKRRISRHPHWWFAYTEGARERIETLGYPSERITVVQNAIDTTGLRGLRRELDGEAGKRFRGTFRLGDGPVAAFVGGLYADKRLEFLIRVADQVARARSDFRLLIIGDGPQRRDVQRWASSRPHVVYLGPLFGQQKVEALAVSSAMLIPGIVGLAVLDAFALEIPLVTTGLESHGPEIEYLIDGQNGLIVDCADDVSTYAKSVVRLLSDDGLLDRLRRGCRQAAEQYTNEEMVERFTEGVIAALAAERLARWV